MNIEFVKEVNEEESLDSPITELEILTVKEWYTDIDREIDMYYDCLGLIGYDCSEKDFTSFPRKIVAVIKSNDSNYKFMIVTDSTPIYDLVMYFHNYYWPKYTGSII